MGMKDRSRYTSGDCAGGGTNDSRRRVMGGIRVGVGGGGICDA